MSGISPLFFLMPSLNFPPELVARCWSGVKNFIDLKSGGYKGHTEMNLKCSFDGLTSSNHLPLR